MKPGTIVKKRYQSVAREIEAGIRSGQYPVGERLPPERDLAETMQTSRTTIREALLMLEFANIIEIKDRSGVIVLAKPTESVIETLSKPLDAPGPYEVLELRRIIEGESCYKAALSASDATISNIVKASEIVAGLEPDDTPEFREANRQFYERIVEASDNSLFVELFSFLWGQKEGPLWESWYGSSRSRENRLTTLRHNEAIAKALQRRRPDAARTAAQRHIDWLISRFLDY